MRGAFRAASSSTPSDSDPALLACTQFLDQQPSPEPLLTGAAELVRAWLADTRDDERSAHDRPEDPAASYSGQWWSSPAHSRLPVTTRGLPSLGAVGLVRYEGGFGGRRTRCWAVGPQGGGRVYQVWRAGPRGPTGGTR